MFALLALVSFVLALFVAAHLLFGGWSPWSGWVRRAP